MTRTGVFISYSQKDIQYLEPLRTHLKYLEKEHQFSIWDDSKIVPGSEWRLEIANAIANAKVAVLLISAHFISSDFISSEELPPLLTAAKHEGALIYPLIVSHCMFAEIPELSKFQAVNPISRPLSMMLDSEKDELFLSITKNIRDALLIKQAPAMPPQERKSASIPGENEPYKRSIATVCVLSLLRKCESKPSGLTLSDLDKLLTNIRRKRIVEAVREMELSKVVQRLKSEGRTCYCLTESGRRLADEFIDSAIFK